MDPKIKKADIGTFREYKTELLDIYVEACRNALNQYVDAEEEGKRIENIFGEGYGFFTFLKERLIGFLLVTLLSHDTLLPNSIKKKYPVQRSLYIAEMHIHRDYRRKGIGTQLLKAFMNDIDRKKYDYLFIRAEKNNVPAMNLYKTLGFIPNESIEEKKMRPDQKGTFAMKKQYLFQKLV
ncbi:MAG: GNAT family N-acetyltransferase [Euryarchaeota archaeon]|nr:GNAT family N-acetyltransferase [Euryarchaeota archaeon]